VETKAMGNSENGNLSEEFQMGKGSSLFHFSLVGYFE